ncbi:MAG TPA: hypothetical protein VMH86_04360 [Rhizomicrobium sp.]|nr:hypothetical protein [Rhizomicrobium sp.]
MANPTRLFFQIFLTIGTILSTLLLLVSAYRVLSLFVEQMPVAAYLWALLFGAVLIEIPFVGFVGIVAFLNYLPTKNSRARLVHAFRLLGSQEYPDLS